MISRNEAYEMLLAQNPEESILHHSLETEAVMTAVARHLQADEQLWGITGLLHDLDFMTTRDDITRHGLVCAGLLQSKLPDDAIVAILAHNSENNGAEAPHTTMDFALRCCETVTGIIAANALVRPEGMAGMKPKSVIKKMKVRSFAANVNREIIMECQQIGLELSAFLQLAIDAITPIASSVGLSGPDSAH
ncbi:HDIG domain-containing protein [Myxococcota bacterium]|nr:HDIG domain-containing protein [Myxococcota bacterium]